MINILKCLFSAMHVIVVLLSWNKQIVFLKYKIYLLFICFYIQRLNVHFLAHRQLCRLNGFMVVEIINKKNILFYNGNYKIFFTEHAFYVQVYGKYILLITFNYICEVKFSLIWINTELSAFVFSLSFLSLSFKEYRHLNAILAKLWFSF